MTTTTVINYKGQLVRMTVYPKSKRKAASSIQKPRYQKLCRGAKYLAQESGQIRTKEE